MKNVFTLIFIGIICLFRVSAQKIIEKNFDYTNQHIELDVKFARNIEVKTWEKSTVYFKATIEIEDAQFIEKYSVDFQQSSNNIVIEEKAEPVYKAMQDYYKKNNKGNSQHWYNTGDKCKFNYVLYIPKNTRLKISSINGDLKSESMEADMTTNLINGNIDIKDYSGDLDLSTINGEIDLKVSNTSLIAETIHGDIYADQKLNLVSEDRHVGQKVQTDGGNFKNKLRLNTINGNMYLRL